MIVKIRRYIIFREVDWKILIFSSDDDHTRRNSDPASMPEISQNTDEAMEFEVTASRRFLETMRINPADSDAGFTRSLIESEEKYTAFSGIRDMAIVGKHRSLMEFAAHDIDSKLGPQRHLNKRVSRNPSDCNNPADCNTDGRLNVGLRKTEARPHVASSSAYPTKTLVYRPKSAGLGVCGMKEFLRGVRVPPQLVIVEAFFVCTCIITAHQQNLGLRGDFQHYSVSGLFMASLAALWNWSQEAYRTVRFMAFAISLLSFPRIAASSALLASLGQMWPFA